MNDLTKILQMVLSGSESLCVDYPQFSKLIARRVSGLTPRRAGLPISRERHGAVEVIDVSGVMVRKAEWEDDISTETLSAALTEARENDEVAAVVLNIDSPGGTVSGQLDLVQAASELAAKKPLYAWAGGYCCSAAYWLAAAADKIYSRNDSHIGSIGTRLMLYDFSQLFGNMGVEAVAIDTGAFKSMGAMGTQITQEHREHLQEIVFDAHKNFEAAVSAGRKMDAEALAAVNNGKVFDPKAALALGLIDGVQSLAEVISAAAAVASPATPVTARNKVMSEQAPAAPAAASFTDLEKALPGAPDAFLAAQARKAATVAEAQRAYMEHLAAENEALREKSEEEAAKAAEAQQQAAAAAAKTPEPTRKKGNTTPVSGVRSDEGEAQPDWRQLAQERMKATGCRWSEACLYVKRRHPESQAFFGVPPKR